jgi:hypothetical protein
MKANVHVYWENAVYKIDGETFIDGVDLEAEGVDDIDATMGLYDIYTSMSITLPLDESSHHDFIKRYLNTHDAIASELELENEILMEV